MPTLEEFKTECRTELQEIRDNEGLYNQVVDAFAGTSERVPITDDEFEQMIIDCAEGKFDAQENGYKKARQQSYLPIEEQLDMQYWDTINNTTTWKDHVTQVKEDNPKP